MEAPSLFFLLLCGITLTCTTGSESLLGHRDDVTSLRRKVEQLEDRMSSLQMSIPHMIQAANEELYSKILDKMAENSENYASPVLEKVEALRNAFQALLSDHSSRMQQLEDDVARMNLNLRKRTFPKKKHSEDEKKSCVGDPPSPPNGRPLDFERKHASEVSYECDKNFILTGNSTVRCHFGKWKGQPPLCSSAASFDPSFYFRTSLDEFYVTNVSCTSDENPQKIEFSRVLDIGTGVGLPTGAKTYWNAKSAVLDLTAVEPKDRRGVYQCGRSGDGSNSGITFIIDRQGWFVRPEVANLGDHVELNHYSYDIPTLRWLHNGKHVPELDGRGKWKFAGVTREDDGFYERYEEGDRQGTQHFYRIVVRGCPPGKFGESCDQQCPLCHNGGICHDLLGVCVCPPGFEGSSCEVACGEDRFGTNCTETCDGGKCFGNLFCKPGPYGCSCVSGYKFDYCKYRGCDGVKFGADCTQNCNCDLFEICDPFTGACSHR